MIVSRRRLTRHIAEQLMTKGSNRSEIISQLASYIVSHRLHAQTEMIVADIARNLAELGVVRARVTTARSLTDELRKDVAKYVHSIETANSVELDEVIDPSIIGGIIIETPSKRFDASITTQLTRLKNV